MAEPVQSLGTPELDSRTQTDRWRAQPAESAAVYQNIQFSENSQHALKGSTTLSPFRYLKCRDDPANFEALMVKEVLFLRAVPEAWLVRTGSADHGALPVTPGLTAPTAGTAEVSRPIAPGPDVRVT